MKLPRRTELQELNRRLKARKEENYLRVLSVLLQEHSASNELVPRLRGHLRARRFDLLYKEADSLSDLSYSDAKSHFLANQIVYMIKKYPWEPTQVGLDPEKAALATFLASERRCKRQNRRFQLFECLRSPDDALFVRAQKWILYVLGESPNEAGIYDLCDFGPGANLGVHGDATSFARKTSADKLTITPGAINYAFRAWMSNHQIAERFFTNRTVNGWRISCWDYESAFTKFCEALSVVSNNKVSFVPKTAKTHRAIAVEPLLNSFLQKGADQEMRARLKRVNIDLADQSRNQQWAREGSLDDSPEGYCTIDLSSASDSISIGLVQKLLPVDWFNFLNRLRSPSYSLSGKVFRSEKFCSMGNGFCFPLQTLIFSALAYASGAGKPGEDFTVYGDDIIVRRKVFEAVSSALRKSGMKLNESKTFSSGPFRESCGADWYRGEDVRPYTLDYALDSLENVFKFLNLTRRSPLSTEALATCFHEVLSWLPEQFRFWRPFKGAPNTGIDPLGIDSMTPVQYLRSKNLQAPKWVELIFKSVEDSEEAPSWCVYAAALRGHDSSCMFTFRRRTRMTVRWETYAGPGSVWVPPVMVKHLPSPYKASL